MLTAVACAKLWAGIHFLNANTFRLTDEILTHLLKFTLLFQVALAELDLRLGDENAARTDLDLLWMAGAETVVALGLFRCGLWWWTGESNAQLDHAIFLTRIAALVIVGVFVVF